MSWKMKFFKIKKNEFKSVCFKKINHFETVEIKNRNNAANENFEIIQN